ncbi:MAG: glycosyltransferase family 2 protein [Candidatus Omnitrophota bacterium]|jgi:cellulose synthase/poly-beta-1,6-N-acetylglucosamine synthase-like glycosyltransferase|nr:MAG: glycosyltransferase family 2 protein [Candidatus Omnitrophota bacterium]
MIHRFLFYFLEWCNYLVVIYFISLNSVYLLTSLLAFRSLRKYARRLKSFYVEEIISTGGAPPITLLAPAYNEEATCVESVKSLLTLRYPDYEILVANDGSKDATFERLREAFDLHPIARAPTAAIPTASVRGMYRSRRHPNLWVLDKENGGKADTLNAGINYCRTPIFCAMDADSLLEPDSLIRLVRPFLENSTTVAAGGIIRIVNDCHVRAGLVSNIRLPRNFLAKFQVLEYLRAFLAGRMGWDAINATLIISGAFGLFRRSVVVEAGGYATKRTSFETVGEDMELVVRLHRYCREQKMPYQIAYVPDPVAWTECPESVKVLGRQRNRWQRGLFEVLIRHRRMLFNPRYGRIGLLAYPYFFFLEGFGPLIELFGYIAFALTLFFGFGSPIYIIGFFAVAFVLGMALSIAAVALEELSFRRYPRFLDLIQLFALSVIETFGYRQLNSFWRVQGFFSALMRKKGWGKMERKGFSREILK